MAEIGERELGVAEPGFQLRRLLVRKLEKRLEQTELVHELESRGMDGVAAEIAQEIRVLFQHGDVDAGPRQQQAEHHPGGAAAHHAAARGQRFGHLESSSEPRFIAFYGTSPAASCPDLASNPSAGG